MADVFLALQKGLGGFERLVVFKRIAAFARSDEDYVDCFMREARVAATMNHPNIVTTLDVGEDNEGPFLVMEYLSGEPLSYVLSALRKRGALMPFQLVSRVAGSIASALDFVHRLALPDGTPWNVVHRDVSPSNVMCCYNGQVKLLDFGVAKINQEEPTQIGMVKGKPSYMSPEQVLSKPLDQRSDIFQLGILCWEMLTGKRLFPNNTAEAIVQICQGNIERPRRIEKTVPSELDDLVMWALEHDIEKRCPSARAFSDQLQSFTQDLYGTVSEHMMQRFMTTQFPERHRERQAIERHTRTAPAELSGSFEVTPSVVPRTSAPAALHSSASNSSVSALMVDQRTPVTNLPRRRRRDLTPVGFAVALGVGAASALLLVTVGFLIREAMQPVAVTPGLEPIVDVAAQAPAQVGTLVESVAGPPALDDVPEKETAKPKLLELRTKTPPQEAKPEPDRGREPVPTDAPALAEVPPVEPSEDAEEPATPSEIRRLTDNLDPWETP